MEQLEEAHAALNELVQRSRPTTSGWPSCARRARRSRRCSTPSWKPRPASGAPATAGMPDDLLALYDRLRASKGGVGAAELRARQCGGCRLTLDNAELQSIAAMAADEVVRCEECQRILVRTDESGL